MSDDAKQGTKPTPPSPASKPGPAPTDDTATQVAPEEQAALQEPRKPDAPEDHGVASDDESAGRGAGLHR